MTPTTPPVWPFPTYKGQPLPKAKPQRKPRRAPDMPEAPF